MDINEKCRLLKITFEKKLIETENLMEENQLEYNNLCDKRKIAKHNVNYNYEEIEKEVDKNINASAKLHCDKLEFQHIIGLIDFILDENRKIYRGVNIAE
jgi:hypothetical protein